MENRMRKYSIAEARDNLARIVHDAEAGQQIEITRRGDSVAVVLSIQQYETLANRKGIFWNRWKQFRRHLEREKIRISPDPFQGIRDRSQGRKVIL